MYKTSILEIKKISVKLQLYKYTYIYLYNNKHFNKFFFNNLIP